MNTFNKNSLIGLLGLCVLFLFTTCKKEVVQKDIQVSSDALTTLNVKGAGVKMIKRPGGGYILVYNEITDFSFSDVAVAIVDENGKLIQKNKFGGRLDELVYDADSDDNGDIYIVGSTNSPELRMDLFTKQVNSSDAYLAKIDKNGQLLWQRGFSDTTAGNRGSQGDDFRSVFVINNKIYCVGTTSNWQTPNGLFTDHDTWMVTFDKDGNKLNDKILPSNPPGVSFSGFRQTNAIKLKDDDLLIRWSALELLSTGRSFDTTSIWMRYHPPTDSLLWVKHFQNGTDEGDMWVFGELANGTILGYTSSFKTVVNLNPGNGEIIKTGASGFTISEDQNDNFYWGRMQLVENDLYMVGYHANGFSLSYAANAGWTQFSDSRPWLVKMDINGEILYDKKIEVPQGRFSDMVLNDNGNLQFMGQIYKFGTKNETIFLMATDRDGSIIPPQ